MDAAAEVREVLRRLPVGPEREAELARLAAAEALTQHARKRAAAMVLTVAVAQRQDLREQAQRSGGGPLFRGPLLEASEWLRELVWADLPWPNWDEIREYDQDLVDGSTWFRMVVDMQVVCMVDQRLHHRADAPPWPASALSEMELKTLRELVSMAAVAVRMLDHVRHYDKPPEFLSLSLLEMLSPRQREAVELCCCPSWNEQGMGPTQAAAKMGISTQRVKELLQEATARMKIDGVKELRRSYLPRPDWYRQ